MPSLVSCEEARSPNVVQSPPRKKYKLSLKLKPKPKKNLMKVVKDDVIEAENNDKIEEMESKEQNDFVEDSTTGNGGTTVDISSSPVSQSVEDNDTVPPLPFAGLANLGNTCYLNAVLQVLRYCPQFTESMANLDQIWTKERTTCTNILDEDEEDSGNNSTPVTPSIIHSIYKLICDMGNAEDNYNKLGMEAEQVMNRLGYTTLAVHPRDFVKEFSGCCPMFGRYQQHDAQEFLRALLSVLEDDCSGLNKDNTEQHNVKENITTLKTVSQTKVRGGCKYPSHAETFTKTCAESTSMTYTSDNKRNETVTCGESKSDSKVDCTSPVVSLSQNNQRCSKCLPNDFNMVQRLFEGTLLLQTRCLNCEIVRKRYDKFQDISVPVQNSKNSNYSNDTDMDQALSEDSEDESEKDRDLSWAISRFASVEKLQGDNKYSCDNCVAMAEAEISTYFEKLPQVLTVHLKRFQTSYGQSVYTSKLVTKVTKNLHTPQTLSLKKWYSKTCTEKNAVYKLFGIVMHNGMSSCSGHYLSYVNIDIVKACNEPQNSGIFSYGGRCVCSCQNLNQCDMDIDNEETVETLPCPENEPLPKPRGIEKYFQPIRKRKISLEDPKKTQDNHQEGKNSHSLSQKCEDSHTQVSSVSENNGCTYEKDITNNGGHGKKDNVSTDELCRDQDCAPRISGNRWLKFDDAEVQEISNKDMEDILSTSSYSTPYLLFYYKT